MTLYSKETDAAVADSEANRHQSMPFPDQVSMEVISHIPAWRGRRLLDLGCGGSANLGMKIQDNLGTYIGIDISPQLLEKTKEQFKLAGREVPQLIEDDVTKNIHCSRYNDDIDIIHARFLLEHLKDGQDINLISRILETGKTAVFIEYDWTYALGNDTVNEFLSLASNLLQNKFGIDLEYGGKLLTKVAEVADKQLLDVSISKRVFEQHNTTETDGLFQVIRGVANIARSAGEAELAKKMLILGGRMRGEVKKGEETGVSFFYTPPPIIAVTVKKNAS